MIPGFHYNSPHTNQYSSICIGNTVYQKYYGPPDIKMPSLSIDLPTSEYIPQKYVMISFDNVDPNNWKFNCMDDAMNFLSRHSKKYHGQFTRQLAKGYSKFCSVLDLVNGSFVPMSGISKREFNYSFMKISKDG